jgi:hypothetical protein
MRVPPRCRPACDLRAREMQRNSIRITSASVRSIVRGNTRSSGRYRRVNTRMSASPQRPAALTHASRIFTLPQFDLPALLWCDVQMHPISTPIHGGALRPRLRRSPSRTWCRGRRMVSPLAFDHFLGAAPAIRAIDQPVKAAALCLSRARRGRASLRFGRAGPAALYHRHGAPVLWPTSIRLFDAGLWRGAPRNPRRSVNSPLNPRDAAARCAASCSDQPESRWAAVAALVVTPRAELNSMPG